MIRWREPRREDRQLAWLWFIAAATAPPLAWLWLRLHLPVPACGFHRLTGLPCPTCGSSRAVVAALHGRLGSAFADNPLMVTVIAFFEIFGLAAPFWLLAGGRVPALGTRLPRLAKLGLVAVFLANWIYLVLAGV